MSVVGLMTHTVTLVRTTTITRDEIGAAVPDVEAETQTVAHLEPRTSDEDGATRDTQIGEWRAYLPPDTDVDGWDRLEWESRSFGVVGKPRPMRNARTGDDSHLEVDLEEIV